jgi:hypothetical protein
MALIMQVVVADLVAQLLGQVERAVADPAQIVLTEPVELQEPAVEVELTGVIQLVQSAVVVATVL